MLNQPEYALINYPLHTHPTFELLIDYGDISNLLDEMVAEIGRFPTQKEYVEAGVMRAKSYFSPLPGKKPDVTKYWGKNNANSAIFNWNDLELQKAVRKRLSRAYPSHLLEYTTAVQLRELYPTFKIGTNAWLDLTAGIDIVVGSPEHNRIVYVHVTSNSQQSNSALNDKKKRWGMARDANNKMHWYERNFNKGHIHLAFDKFKETDSTRFINGNPILKTEHLKHVMDSAMSVPDPTLKHFDTWYPDEKNQRAQQLLHLHNFLLQNKVDEKGLGTVWI